jgi:hypothetical protein
MKTIVALLGLGLLAVPLNSAANDAKTPTLQLKPKAAMMAAAPQNYANAPFVAPLVPEPELDLVPRAETRSNDSRSSCEADRSLCYDVTSGRIVYKPARALMPDIPGLKRENISVKRDKIILRYSF